MRRITGGLAAAAASGICVALAAGLGCNAIAGIQDGQLATMDSGSVVDGTAEGSVDGGGMDGPTGDAGGMDSTTASDSTAPPGDASDAAPLPPVKCTVNPGSTLLIADLSSFADAGLGTQASQFAHALWIFPVQNNNSGAYVVAQLSSDQNDFTLYQVDFGQHTATPQPAGSSGTGGVRLIDVEPTPGGVTAMATIGNGTNTSALQVVPLPMTFGGAPGTPTTISGTVLNNQYPSNATMSSPGNGVYYWLLGARNNSQVTELLSGSNANATMGQVVLVNGTAENVSFSTPPLDMNGNLYAFVNGYADGGSETVFAYPDDLSSMGTQSQVVSNDPLALVASAHASVTDSTKAAVLALSLNQSGAGSAQLWAGKVPPSQLTSLDLAPPQFTAGTTLGITDLAFNAGGSTPFGDQLLSIGTSNAAPGQLNLLWINDNGIAVTRPSTMGPLLTSGNTGNNVIRLSAINVGQQFTQLFVSMFVTWIEEVVPGGGGQEYDQLYGAQVTCQPVAGD